MNNEKIYKYEMHVHTTLSGGGAPIREHIDALIEKGYQGMVVTNHFYSGDNRVDKSLSWEDFVGIYRRDFLNGLEYARGRDFDLLFGIEEHVENGQEILIYGITPYLLETHPELKTADAEKYCEVVHAVGGLVYQAHPYRAWDYITRPFPLECLDKLDGIEVYNAANLPEWNEMAEKLSRERGLNCIGGSDGHSTNSVGRSGISVKKRIKTNAALVEILKNGEYTIIK